MQKSRWITSLQFLHFAKSFSGPDWTLWHTLTLLLWIYCKYFTCTSLFAHIPPWIIIHTQHSCLPITCLINNRCSQINPSIHTFTSALSSSLPQTLFVVLLISCFDRDDGKLLETQLYAPLLSSSETQSVPINTERHAVISPTEFLGLLILYIICKSTNYFF